jgi:hypothetical protein
MQKAIFIGYPKEYKGWQFYNPCWFWCCHPSASHDHVDDHMTWLISLSCLSLVCWSHDLSHWSHVTWSVHTGLGI